MRDDIESRKKLMIRTKGKEVLKVDEDEDDKEELASIKNKMAGLKLNRKEKEEKGK